MPEQNPELLKQREINFAALSDDTNPAASAAELLDGLAGIVWLKAAHNTQLLVEFDLSCVSLRQLEDALITVGYHLDNSILNKIKRALYHYTEETQLANMGDDHAESKSTTQIFISSYIQRRHDCRDERPSYYRHYN